MGVANSEVGYTPAMPRRGDHEVHKDMWGHWTKKKTSFIAIGLPQINSEIICDYIVKLNRFAPK